MKYFTFSEDLGLLDVKGLFSLAGKIYAANPVMSVEIEAEGKEKNIVKSVREGKCPVSGQSGFGKFAGLPDRT